MDVARNKTIATQSIVTILTELHSSCCNKSTKIVKSEIFEVNLSEINIFQYTI